MNVSDVEFSEGALRNPQGFYEQSFARGELIVGRRFRQTGKKLRDDSSTTETFGIGNSYLCGVHLRHMLPGHTWWDGHHLPTPELFEGSLHIHDQRYDWRSELEHPFDCLLISLPQPVLNAASGRADATVEIARPTFDAERIDTTMLHLARAMLPALARPDEINTLFSEHVMMAMATHLAATYGTIEVPRHRRGKLAAWQVARVNEFLMANLAADISIKDLARICGLSDSHFSHAFAATMGAPPHRYLLGKRIARARDLLERSGLGLQEIALNCGFADQSHLTRVFSRALGQSPGQWRRMRLS